MGSGGGGEWEGGEGVMGRQGDKERSPLPNSQCPMPNYHIF
ncbi:hypothetical protein [Tolypothrix sp. VBCCA 56010]